MASPMASVADGQGERVACERRPSNNISSPDGAIDGDDDSQHDRDEISREHQESWSLMAAFSPEGLEWGCGMTRTRELVGIAERFARSNSRHLLSNQHIALSSKSLETDEVTAWEYVNGECPEIRLHPQLLLNITVPSLL